MKNFLTRTQAAARLGVCTKTLRNLHKRGVGPEVIMIGTRPAYSLDALEAYIARGGDR